MKWSRNRINTPNSKGYNACNYNLKYLTFRSVRVVRVLFRRTGCACIIIDRIAFQHHHHRSYRIAFQHHHPTSSSIVSSHRIAFHHHRIVSSSIVSYRIPTSSSIVSSYRIAFQHHHRSYHRIVSHSNIIIDRIIVSHRTIIDRIIDRIPPSSHRIVIDRIPPSSIALYRIIIIDCIALHRTIE